MAAIKEEVLQAATITLEAALDIMRFHQIPTTAENIIVWYHYVEGDLPKLNAELDRVLARQSRLPANLTAELYQRFFVELDRKRLELLQAAIRRLIELFSSNVSSFCDDVSEFRGILLECAEGLSSNCDADTLVSIVERTLEQTQLAMESSRQTHVQIETLNNEIAQLRSSLNELERSALEDSLTSVSNRRAFDQIFPQLLDKYRGTAEGFCLLLVDVDNFKKFNDRYGHQVGDKVLRFVATMLKNVSKGQDIVARYGGEEFAVMLPAKGYRGGMALAEQIRKTIAAARLSIDAEKEVVDSVTVSVGVSWSRASDTPDAMFKRADQSLLNAKGQGRNVVVGQNHLDIAE